MQWRKYSIIALVVVISLIAATFLYRQIKNKLIHADRPAYNIILIVSDQQAFRLREANGYHLPAHEELQQHGVTFANHYAAAAMCSPSRASFLTGTPPQVNGVFDQMGYTFTPTLSPSRPNMGSVLKSLGYYTAYFGKFEMDKDVLKAPDNVNTTTAIQAYGFDVFNPDGDTSGKPRQGYYGDPYYVGEAVRWLHQHATPDNAKPFFMVVSLLNPHDIMFADVNIPGTPQDQKPLLNVIQPAPLDDLYATQWQFTLPDTLQESLQAIGMPNALLQYQDGWSASFGFIPTNRPDMWIKYYNYYLNAIRDDDRKIKMLNDTLTEMGLWKNTIVIFTADHGDMGGTHGGLRGKGPMAYEENAHVPLIIAHPDAKQGATTQVLTSHLDLLPTMIGLTGLNSDVSSQLAGHDFSSLIKHPEEADIHVIRPAILFNYVGLSTVDSRFLVKALSNSFKNTPFPALSELDMSKRGFLTFIFDGRYKFARFYAPDAFNTPTTLRDIYDNNDVQLFDLQNDPDEAHNLALEPDKYGNEMMRLNTLMNELIAKEVGKNDGAFLPLASPK